MPISRTEFLADPERFLTEALAIGALIITEDGEDKIAALSATNTIRGWLMEKYHLSYSPRGRTTKLSSATERLSHFTPRHENPLDASVPLGLALIAYILHCRWPTAIRHASRPFRGLWPRSRPWCLSVRRYGRS